MAVATNSARSYTLVIFRPAGSECARSKRLLDARLQIEDVGANLLRDADGDRIPAVPGDQQSAIRCTLDHLAKIRNPNGGAVLHDDGSARNLIHARPQAGSERQMLLAGFGKSPHREELVLRLQLL